MKKSIYNYVVKQDNNYLVFNALYHSCVVLSKQEYKLFKRNKGEVEQFKDLGFYCDKDLNEQDVVLFTSRYVSEQDNSFFYRIYTTMACNARCPYCYEKGIKPEHMSYQTADALIEFIVKNCRENSHIVLEWFGGEPLVNEKIIDYICEKLTQLLKEKKASFNSNMVSNGLLFEKRNLEKYKTLWNLNRVQITLDGTKAIYEKIKGFAVENAFDKVIENIKWLAENQIKVNIRLNYDKNNFEDILSLIEFLGQNFKDNPKVFVYARKIMADNLDNSFKASAKTDIIIFKKLVEQGLLNKQSLLKTIPRRTNMCVAHMLNAYLVSPTGKFGKCSQALFKEDIGDVFEGVKDRGLLKWCTPKLENKCLKCKLLPICNGGCLFEKFNKRNYCYYSEKVLKYKLKTFLEDYLEKERK